MRLLKRIILGELFHIYCTFGFALVVFMILFVEFVAPRFL